MPMDRSPHACDCCSNVSRRSFIKTFPHGRRCRLPRAQSRSGSAARPRTPSPRQPGSACASETLVGHALQKSHGRAEESVAFPFDHPLRSKVDNNWQITDKKLSQFFTPDQQAMVREIFLGLHSPEYAERVMKQVEHDGEKEGFGGCAIALFGEPGSGKFEFVLTGRHVTRRCDGDSVEGAAFGGPIFYGHAAKGFNEKPDHPGNAYWYQAVRANHVFQMLNGKQREMALLAEPREEQGTNTVKLPAQRTGSARHSGRRTDPRPER